MQPVPGIDLITIGHERLHQLPVRTYLQARSMMAMAKILLEIAAYDARCYFGEIRATSR